MTPEQVVVKQIRCDNGVDEDLVRQARNQPEVWNTILKLKQKLEKSLQLLSDELYSKPAHFVLEVLQNADDNSYPVGVTPELRITLRQRFMEIHCNESGFSAENVKAFCGIGQSTKRNQTGYIGEKGIGAKSMFKVANKVQVHSLGYHFVLDRAAELGMISPQWTSSSLNEPGWTVLRLEFCDDEQFAAVKKQLRQVRESVLLFMRRLARLTVDDGEKFSVRREVQGNIVSIVTTSGSSTIRRRFFCVTETINAYRHEPKRAHSQTTDIVLAFPLNDELLPEASRQMVHAFLPMRSVGFKFIVQADFLTAANREDILSDLQWNNTLRAGIVSAFRTAVSQFRSMDKLQMTWLHFLPNPSDVVDSFFSPIARDILNRLRSESLVLDARMHYRTPRMVKFPSPFSSSAGEGLVPDAHLSFYYVSNDYPSELRSKLELLGVSDMTFGEFVEGLCSMGGDIAGQGNAWLEQTCSLLNGHGFTWKWSTYHLVDDRIRYLPLARLADGNWVRCGTGETLLFNSYSSQFPSGLGFDVLMTDSSAKQRKQLLERLGVREIDASVVVEKILQVHRSSSPLSATQALEHALYVFQNGRSVSLNANSLRLADISGGLAYGGDLYMDDDAYKPPLGPLSGILRTPARFIHSSFSSPSSYLLANWRRSEWRNWLQSQFGVSTVPRVASGIPKQEFVDLVNRLRLSDTSLLLSLLRVFWNGICAQLSTQDRAALNSYFAGIDVCCRNGDTVPLGSTFVLNPKLSQYATSDLPHLPVSDSDGDWSFLRSFGVSTEVDAKFFLKQLLALSQTAGVKQNQVSDVYRQLSARFLEIPDEIRFEFNSRALFFVNEKWLTLKDVVWNGPWIMTLKTALAMEYPFLADLFQAYLGISDAPQTIIADELRAYSKRHQNAPLSKEDIETLFDLLLYADRTVSDIRKGTCLDWTADMGGVAMLPVLYASSHEVRLSACNEDFFLADPSGYLKHLFADRLDLLSLSSSHLVDLGDLIGHLGLYAKRIDRRVTQTVLIDDALLEEGITVGDIEELETQEYQSRVGFIARVQYRSLIRTSSSKKRLIKSVVVYGVRSIIAKYALDDSKVDPVSGARACWATFDDTGNLKLYIASTSSRRDRLTGVVEAIIRVLRLREEDHMAIAAVLHFGEDDEIDQLLQRSGFPDVGDKYGDGVEDLYSRAGGGGGAPDAEQKATAPSTDAQARLQAALRQVAVPSDPSSFHETSSTVSPPSPSTTIAPSAEPAEPIDRYVQSTRGHNEIDLIKAAALQTSLPSVVAIAAPASTAIPSSDFSLPSSCESYPQEEQREAFSLSDISIHLSKNRSSRSHSYEDARMKEIGFLGEQFVFELLKNYLKDCAAPFTYANWTSPFRSLAGFPSFSGDELADFVYHDTQGILTQRLFPSDSEYHGSTPEYFIEVKSTSGDQDRPFFMKRRQFHQALRLSRSTRDANAPLQLYVLFRVSNVGTGGSPVLKTYEDPHDMLSRGTLRIQSDSVEVRIIGDD